MHVTFPPNTNPLEVVAVHPTELYETTLMLLVFAWLWRARTHHHAVGWRFGVYLVLAGVERFLIEFIRAKDDRFFGPLSLAQLASLGVVLIGVVITARLWAPDAVAPPVAGRLAPRPATA